MVSMVVLAGYALMFSTAGVDTVRAIPVARIGAESTGTDGFLFGEVSGMALDVRDPRTGLPSRFDRYIDGPAMLAYRIKLPTVLDSADRILAQSMDAPRQGHSDGVPAIRFKRQALERPRGSDVLDCGAFDGMGQDRCRRWSDGGRVEHRTLCCPAVYAVTSRGTIVTGGGERYELTEVNAEGRVVRHFRQWTVPRRIPATERAESLRDLRRRIASLPVPIARLEGTTEAVRRQDLPHTFPPYTGVVAQPDGSIWVRQWPTRSNETSYDVFDGAAVFRYTLVIPARCEALPPPVSNGRHIVCLTVDEDSGEEMILWFRISVR